MLDWNKKNKLKAITVLIWAVSNFIILNIVRPGGLMAYILPSILWGSLALYVAVVSFGKIRSWSNMQVTVAAASVVFIYVIVLLDIGFFSGFGRNSQYLNSQYFNLNVIPLSFMMLVFTLLGMEFSRAFLVRELGGRRPLLAIGGTALLFSIFGISTVRLLSIGGGLEASKFVGSTYLPLLAGNLLASYLVAIGGPVASLAYLGPLKVFWWFSPLLPHLSWGFEALLGVMIPIMGYLIINKYVSSSVLRKAGMHEESKGFGNKDEGLDLGWVAIPVACVLVVWFSTGLVGVHPTTIMSGSMRPSIDVGDMVIVRDVNAESVVEGDIVLYWNGDEMVVHRVVDMEHDRNNRVFVTKGDANSTPDSEPVTARQIQGKVMFTVPMIGWASIGVKSALFGAWAFLSTSSYMWVLIGLAVLLYLARKFSSRMGGSSWRRNGRSFGKKAGVLAVVLLVGTASSGVVYSHWAEKLQVSAELETGEWKSGVQVRKTLYGAYTNPSTGEDLSDPSDIIHIDSAKQIHFSTRFKLVIDVKNCGSTELTNVVVTDTIKNTVAPASWIPTQGSVDMDEDPSPGDDFGFNDFRWEVGNLTKGESASLTIWIETLSNPTGKYQPTSGDEGDSQDIEINDGATVMASSYSNSLSATTSGIKILIVDDGTEGNGLGKIDTSLPYTTGWAKDESG